MRVQKRVNGGGKESGSFVVTASLIAVALGIVVTLLTQTTWVSDQIQERVIDMHKDAVWAPEMEYKLGLYCSFLNNNKHAREVYDKLQQDYPLSEFVPKALFRLAQMLDEEGQRSQAIGAYKKALEVLPENDPWREECERKIRAYSSL